MDNKDLAAIVVGSALAFICIMVYVVDFFCPSKRDAELPERLADPDYDIGKSNKRNYKLHSHHSQKLQDESET